MVYGGGRTSPTSTSIDRKRVVQGLRTTIAETGQDDLGQFRRHPEESVDGVCAAVRVVRRVSVANRIPILITYLDEEVVDVADLQREGDHATGRRRTRVGRCAGKSPR